MHPFDFIRNNDEKLGQYFIYPRRIGIRFELYERRPQSLGLDLRMGEDTALWIKAGITGSGALLWLAGNFLEKPAEVEAEQEEE
jgi:cell division ABC efflux transporter, permease protein ftsX